MIRLLQLLIFGHVHKWKIIAKSEVFEENGAQKPVYIDYNCQCEACGKIRMFRC